MEYESTVCVESRRTTGVRFVVARMSFGRRVELMRRVRELARRGEFLQAGKGAGDKRDAGVLRADIDRLYLLWGLRGVEGLRLDGVDATPEMLADAGPEELFQDALWAVKGAAGLDEAERKN